MIGLNLDTYIDYMQRDECGETILRRERRELKRHWMSRARSLGWKIGKKRHRCPECAGG